ncbi:MAG TPA: ABATE domain-containing protein [Jatrophihabitantaceae bacterium]
MVQLASREAPGRLEVVRAFVNTRDIESRIDLLATPADLAGWLGARRLTPPGVRLEAPALRAATELREALRTLLRAHNGQEVDTAPALDVLNRISARAGLLPVMAYDGSVGYRVTSAGGIGALGSIVAIVYAAQGRGVWTRLKACSADACQWAYYDASRNRASRWCHMQVCGNRAKGQAFRARRAEGDHGNATTKR